VSLIDISLPFESFKLISLRLICRANAPLSANLNLGTVARTIPEVARFLHVVSTILVDFAAKIPLKSHGLPLRHYYAAPSIRPAGDQDPRRSTRPDADTSSLPEQGTAAARRFLLFRWHRARTCVSPGGTHRNFGECQQTANCSTQYTILYSWVYRNFKLV
jgi:hypothetical protein